MTYAMIGVSLAPRSSPDKVSRPRRRAATPDDARYFVRGRADAAESAERPSMPTMVAPWAIHASG